MITIVSSTNRSNCNSLEIAKHIANLLEQSDQDVSIANLQDLPHDFIQSALYNNSGKNEAFNKIRDKVQQADKLFFVIPEYNGSFPGILKAFIDGLKFPEGIKGVKSAMIGISSGTQGAALAMSHFTDILNYLGSNVLAIKPRVTNIESSFVNGKISDEKLTQIIKDQIKAFIEF